MGKSWTASSGLDVELPTTIEARQTMMQKLAHAVQSTSQRIVLGKGC